MRNTAPKKGGEVLPSPAAAATAPWGRCPWAWDLPRRWEEAVVELCFLLA